MYVIEQKKKKKIDNNNNTFLCMFIFNEYEFDTLFFDAKESTGIYVQEQSTLLYNNYKHCLSSKLLF